MARKKLNIKIDKEENNAIDKIVRNNVSRPLRIDYSKKIIEKDGLSFIRSRFKNKFTKPQNFSVSSIILKPEIFQGRNVPFASETVQKIVKEGFDSSQDPIVLFKDKTENIVISGHSRFEAAKKLKLKTIPVKFFNGDLDDAIDYALIESNRSGKAEGIESDIKAYLRAKQRGYNREFLKGIFKSDSYIDILRLISFLSPRGKFIEILSKGEDSFSKSFPYLLRNSAWVGLLRNLYPEISDIHENEIFNFLYKSEKGLKIKKQAFFDLIKKKVESPVFDKNKPLRLDKEKEFDVIKESDPGFVLYKQTQTAINNWSETRLKKEENLMRSLIANPQADVKKAKEEITAITESLHRKLKEFIKLKESLRKEDKRLQTGGLLM